MLIRLFIPLLTILISCHSAADTSSASTTTVQAPKTFVNVYKAKVYGFDVSVTHELKEHEQGQEMLFNVDNALVKIKESSVFDWAGADQLRPLSYTYKRTGLGRNRSAELTFDWQENKVTNNVQKKPWKMDILPGIKDKLNFQVQLQHDLIAGKVDLTYQIADGGEIKQYTFSIESTERITTPLGEVDTIKVKRTRKDSNRVTYAWMAPEYRFVLVRMQQESGGNTYTIDIHQSVIDGKTLTHF